MLKLIYCIRRKDGLTREAFLKTWLQDHAPLVKSYAGAMGAVRYVQSHTGFDDLNAQFQASRQSAEPFDGVTEIWWDSRAAYEAALATPEAKVAGRALFEDEKRFIDFERSSVFFTEEYEVF